jgi:hypothetical protein
MGRPRIIKHVCIQCEENLPEKNFFSLKPKKEYDSRDGKLPICRDCLWKLSTKTSKLEVMDLEGFIRQLRKMDLPFLKDVYRSASKNTSGKSVIGRYISMLSLTTYNKNLYYDYSVFTDDDDKNEELKVKMINEVDFRRMINDENTLEIAPGVFQNEEWLSHKFGIGFKTEELVQFERNYMKLAKDVEIDGEKDEQNLVMVSMIQWQLSKAIRNGDISDIDKLTRVMTRQMKELKTIDNGEKADSLSMLMKMVARSEGAVNFDDYGYLDKPNDLIDKYMYYSKLMEREIQGLDNNNFTYRDMYAYFDEKIKELDHKEEQELNAKFDPDKYNLDV